jgi:hypothetical protein
MPTKILFICDECSQTFDNPEREGKTCGIRLPGGHYCAGVINRVEEVTPDPEILTCDECERTADNMAYEGRRCGMRLSPNLYCQGFLRRGTREA